jgi:hypothetical protein
MAMNLCACTDIQRCADCDPFECAPDTHYCPTWRVAEPLVLQCRCGQALWPYEVGSWTDTGISTIYRQIWSYASDVLDADDYTRALHDVWRFHPYEVTRIDGACRNH